MPHTIGISFSKNHCFLAEIGQDKERLALKELVSFSYDHDPADALRSHASVIQNFISKKTRVILSLPSQEVLLQQLVLDPTLKDGEIVQHITAQTQVLFGCAVDQVSFDYERQSSNETEQPILIASCPRKIIRAYQHLFDEIHLPLHVIDIDRMSINLLPWRETQREQANKNKLKRLGIFAVLLFMLSIIGKCVFYIDMQRLLHKMNMTQKQMGAIKLTDPNKIQDALLKKLIFFNQQKQVEIKQNTLFEKGLLHIANAIPNSIVLSQASLDVMKMALTGKTNQLSDIHHYVNQLQNKMPNHLVELTHIQTDSHNQKELQFTIVIQKRGQEKS